MRPVSFHSDLIDEAPVGHQEMQRRRLLPASRMKFLAIDTALSDIEKAAARSTSQSCGPFSVFALVSGDGEPKSLPLAFDEAEACFEQDGQAVQDPAETHCIDDQGASDMDFACLDDPITPGPGHRSVDSSVGQRSPRMNCAATVPIMMGTAPDQDQLGGGESNHSLTTEPDSESPAAWGCLDGDSSAEVFLKGRVRHLLRNYVENVIPIFTPLDQTDLPVSPWRDFHLSRALQCSIELEILGKATPSRRALLHTILTISAYNLRNVNSLDKDISRDWGHVASDYKCEALKLLEACVGESYADLTDSVYNELLAAMLCMVTIDVISGDTSTSQIHLGASEALIRARIARCGIPVCHITKGLYIIFLYLRTMQEATNLLCDQPQQSPSSASAGTGNDQTLEDIAALMLAGTCGEDFESGCFEVIYGLPRSLLFLLRKVTRILGTIDQWNATDPRDPNSPSTRSEVDDLEDEILEWPIERIVARMGEAPVSGANRLIMQHYTSAFYKAIIIFYSRKAQNMHRRHVQPYVHDVIQHLEKIDQVKDKHGFRTGHLPWAAFVAGSQAMGESTQDRFLRWFNKISGEGIWTSTLSRDALVEIWTQTNTPVGFSALSGLNLVLT
ncbi:hypothetical protein NM208_g690 [Fusarium decemcellulare]|uniref:Uncharacterized protein n=1 Tax=Fusarium decemcellulare TaxID=57161 RepID=A0ACC1SYW3_9HYPO|nr:hypothetical protein NM208_g690 [Fusarium decemcellulare]